MSRALAIPWVDRRHRLERKEIPVLILPQSNAMFPDAAAAIATQKAAFTQKTGNPPASNRNSAVYDNRSSLNAPLISTPGDNGRENLSQPPPSPWGLRNSETPQPIARPKSSAGQQPMGQFTQPPASGGIRAGRPQQLSGSANLQKYSSECS